MPIVEPDVSLSGTHTLEQAVDINIKVQAELFKAMIDHGVYMPGCTLKPNIINPGKDCKFFIKSFLDDFNFSYLFLTFTHWNLFAYLLTVIDGIKVPLDIVWKRLPRQIFMC